MIHWSIFNPDDQNTHPSRGEVVLVMCRKSGKARIYTEAFIDARGVWRVLVRDKSLKLKGSTPLGDYDLSSLAWTRINVPLWWKPKSKEEQEINIENYINETMLKLLDALETSVLTDSWVGAALFGPKGSHRDELAQFLDYNDIDQEFIDLHKKCIRKHIELAQLYLKDLEELEEDGDDDQPSPNSVQPVLG